MALTKSTRIVITSKGLARVKQRGLGKAILWPSSQRPRWILQTLRQLGPRGATVGQIIRNSASYLTGFEVKSGWGDPHSRHGVELAQEAVMKALKKLLSAGYAKQKN